MRPVISATEGQMICRPTTWIDVLKFFLFNYGLHVLTMVSVPGCRTFPTVIRALTALLMPFSGIFTALDVIERYARGQSGDIRKAHRAGALCMVMPTAILTSSAQPIERLRTEVHGQHPKLVNCHPIVDSDVGLAAASDYSLIMVPKLFTVAPFGDPNLTPLTLSCNYSIVKPIMAIIQVVYGSIGLYESSVRQLPRFGYAAYSLTVIPYVIMSFVNLVASFCEPQYPTMFLVRYRGSLDAQGGDLPASIVEPDTEAPPEPAPDYDDFDELVPSAVGEAFGRLSQDLAGNPRLNQGGSRAASRWIIVRLGGLIFLGVPYLIIYLLTGFDGRQSTNLQRGFTMAWLAIGQWVGMTFSALPAVEIGNCAGLSYLLVVLMFGVEGIGGFVVVGQMMMSDEVCTVI